MNYKKTPSLSLSAHWIKKFRRKMVIPRLLYKKLSIPEKVSEKQKSYLTKFFVLVLWDKIFSKKPWWPLTYAFRFETFRYQKVSELQESSPMKFSATVIKKFPGSWYFSIPIHRNFSRPETFRNIELFPHCFFRHCETKTVDGKWWSPSS